MTELKKCPLCNGQTMLCQNTGVVSICPEFSILCLECGVEFKIHSHPSTNMVMEPAEAAKRIIERFNRRRGDPVKNDELIEQCDFCSKWDWGEAAAAVDNGEYAHILLAGGSYRFPADRQFRYCPVCGCKNPNKEVKTI